MLVVSCESLAEIIGVETWERFGREMLGALCGLTGAEAHAVVRGVVAQVGLSLYGFWCKGSTPSPQQYCYSFCRRPFARDW